MGGWVGRWFGRERGGGGGGVCGLAPHCFVSQEIEIELNFVEFY